MQTSEMTATKLVTTSEVSERTLAKLLDKATEEIASYRQRQITMFRETAIVEAITAWGISQLKLQQNTYGWCIRISAAIACLVASIIGCIMIMSFNERIKHVRLGREKLAEQLQILSNIDPAQLFYPAVRESGEGWWSWLITVSTSKIYSFTLIILGVLAALVSILAGLAMR
jgi:hypothetical protein